MCCDESPEGWISIWLSGLIFGLWISLLGARTMPKFVATKSHLGSIMAL